LLAHGRHPSAWLGVGAACRALRLRGGDGLIAYAEAGGWWFQLTSIHAPEEERGPLLEAFRAAARAAGKRVCALQLRPQHLPRYEAAGFRCNQLGSSYTVDLDRWAPTGPAFARLRNKVRRARRAGVEVVELGVEAPRSEVAWRRLDSVGRAWLATKAPALGRRPRLLRVLVGELGEPGDRERRVFVARRGERWLGFVTYVPSPVRGAPAGVLHDLSRRVPGAPPGTMELVNWTAVERLREEGVGRLSFGFTPFAGLDPAHARPSRSACVDWQLRLLARHGGALYPAASQVAYKRKWGPHLVEPEYLALDGRYSPSVTLRLLQLVGLW
jgi:lysylphosphatidylglycerol synthetase-like protein (DUF2156 family)